MRSKKYMDQEDDLWYIVKVLDGDSSYYSFLVEKYESKAYTLALRIVRNEEDAQEVSQDAFLKAFKSLSKFKREASFSSWLYRIVYNTSLSRIKKKQIKTTELTFESENISIDETQQGFARLVKEDRKRYLQLAMNQLSEEESTMINLFYSDDKNADEIGEIMSLSHGNVRVKLLRTRKKLLTILSQALNKEIREIL